MKHHLLHTDRKGLLPLQELVPEIEQFLNQRKTLTVHADPEPAIVEPPMSEKKKQNEKKIILKAASNKPRWPACQFCSEQQEEFRDSEKLDLHYVLNCLMLTKCDACGQIIEVMNVN